METENLERRDFRAFPAAAELRVERRADGAPVIKGTSMVFGSLSEDLGGFREVLDPDIEITFSEELVSLYNHDPNMVLGRVPLTLAYQRTATGVAYEVTPPDTRADVVATIERGDVRGNSFMFYTQEDRWEQTPEGQIRHLRAIQVEEMGPVVFPAYRDTDVAIAQRSRARWTEERTKATPGELRRRALDLA